MISQPRYSPPNKSPPIGKAQPRRPDNLCTLAAPAELVIDVEAEVAVTTLITVVGCTVIAGDVKSPPFVVVGLAA